MNLAFQIKKCTILKILPIKHQNKWWDIFQLDSTSVNGQRFMKTINLPYLKQNFVRFKSDII